MSTTPREPEASSRSHEILRCAREVLEREGAAAITMRRLAQAVGVTPMALYRYFANREALLQALADEGFAQLAERFEMKPPRHRPDEAELELLRIVDVHLAFALEQPHRYELMFLSPRPGARRYPADFQAERSPTANVAARLLEQGMASGYFRRDDVWAITVETGAMLQGLVLLFLGGRLAMDEAAFRTFCRRAMARYLRGLRL